MANTSVPALPGEKLDSRDAAGLRYAIKALLGRPNTSFPGAQPVSFAQHHLTALTKEDYYVCEKTDGIRCLMYLTSDNAGHEIVFLIDRKNDFYRVPDMHFPLENGPDDSFHTDTLLDGELVNDTEPDGSLKTIYLVFDCLVMDGNKLMHRTLDKRLGYLGQKLLDPYKKLYQRFPDELQYVPFQVDFKHQEFGYGLDKMFDSIIPSLKHGSDGLIFTCRQSPYTPGTDPNILKWKPENENSVDFRMWLEFPTVDPDSDDEGGPYPDYTALPTVKLTSYAGEGRDVYYADMALDATEWESLKGLGEPLNERIVECYREKSGKWRWLRFRDDKQESNHKSVVESVVQSIEDGVTQDDLIHHQDRIKDEWKKRQAAASEQSKRESEARKAGATAASQGSKQNGHSSGEKG